MDLAAIQALMASQQTHMDNLAAQNTALMARLTEQMQLQRDQIAAQIAAAGAPVHAPLRTPDPKRFTGTMRELEPWIQSLQFIFELQGLDDTRQVRYAATTLDGHAAEWYSRTLAGNRPATFAALTELLRKEYVPITAAVEARDALRGLKQGSKFPTVHDYQSEFCRLHAIVKTTSVEDRVYSFIQGLRPDLRSKLLGVETPYPTVEAAATAAARKDLVSKHASGSSSSAPPPSGAVPMDLDTVALEARLADITEQLAAFTTRNDRGYGRQRYDKSNGVSKEEIQRRRDNRLCYHCGSDKHIKRDCPTVGQSGTHSGSTPASSSGSRPQSKNGNARRGE